MTSKNVNPVSDTRKKELFLFIEKLNIGEIYLEKIQTRSDNFISIFNEALTHTSANQLFNHEKLEFLGDAVLRLTASEFIEKNFSSMQVGERSALRSQLVSDEWLTKVGKSILIEKVLLVGPKASRDLSAIATFQAEATEAVIGALYQCLKDFKPIHKWLNPYWEKESKIVLADPHRNNSKSALQEWSQGRGLMLPTYEIQELTKIHGSAERFFCKVKLEGIAIAEGWGGSRKEAEKKAAKYALEYLNQIKE
tara:strand:+ start:244 stop:999 length:756 start_codon:yes stop_codon:yes gene_type:complete